MDLDSAKALLGSPAWAGIDPLGAFTYNDAGRFPRVGGDRPKTPPPTTPGMAVPPRGRG